MRRPLKRAAMGALLLVVVLVLIAVAEGIRQGRDAKPLPGPPLRELGSERGIVVGTAVRAKVLRGNKAYRQIAKAQFQSFTPENEMKWEIIEPQRGEFDFDPADEIVDAARRVRGHALVWHNQLPSWVDDLSSNELRAAMREHISRVMAHYRGRVPVWDVVNEAISDKGGLRPSPFLDKLGEGYVAQAFRLARRADPKARLYINDYGADGLNPKSDRLYELVRSLRMQGVPIDGVGLQVHLTESGVPAGLVANLRRFEALGVELAITEADVALKVPAGAAALRTQAKIYGAVVRSCRAVRACRELTFWGFTDGRSWIPKTLPGLGAGTLLDEKLRPKPAYGAVQRALQR